MSSIIPFVLIGEDTKKTITNEYEDDGTKFTEINSILNMEFSSSLSRLIYILYRQINSINIRWSLLFEHIFRTVKRSKTSTNSTSAKRLSNVVDA